MIQDIKTPQPYLRVFPNPDSVFADPVDKYARHLLPCVSIDLAQVNPEWSGWIHLVSPVGPMEGYIGDDTMEFHNDYLKSNWLAFRLNEDNRYQLLGDFRYFHLEIPSEELDEHDLKYQAKLEKFYADIHARYRLAKERYERLGKLYSSSRYLPKDRNFSDEEPENLVDLLGGGAPYGNWVDGDLTVNEDDTDDAFPVGPDGKRFYFVASVTGQNYSASGADWIVLFYQPESRTVLLTFDWS